VGKGWVWLVSWVETVVLGNWGLGLAVTTASISLRSLARVVPLAQDSEVSEMGTVIPHPRKGSCLPFPILTTIPARPKEASSRGDGDDERILKLESCMLLPLTSRLTRARPSRGRMFPPFSYHPLSPLVPHGLSADNNIDSYSLSTSFIILDLGCVILGNGDEAQKPRHRPAYDKRIIYAPQAGGVLSLSDEGGR